MPRATPPAVLLLAGLVLVSAQADCQGSRSKRNDRKANAIVESWRDDLREAELALLRDDARSASQQIDRVLDDMTERIVEPGGMQGMIAATLALRALAAVQLGNEGEGIWHWQVATQLFPEAQSFNLSRHGRAGEVLLAHPAPDPKHAAELPSANDPRIADADPRLTKPKKLAAAAPDFPRSKRGKTEASLLVQTVIGTDGTLSSPLVLRLSGDPLILVRVLDRVREWRFRPATRDGEPVPVAYNLTFDYRRK